MKEGKEIGGGRRVVVWEGGTGEDGGGLERGKDGDNG